MDVDVPLDWHKGVFPFWGAGWGGTHHVSTGGTPFDSNHCRELVYSTVVMTGPVNERKRLVYETSVISTQDKATIILDIRHETKERKYAKPCLVPNVEPA